MSTIDDYVKNVIQIGDEGSALLAAQCASTLENQPDHVRVISQGKGGIAVLDDFGDDLIITHSNKGKSGLSTLDHTYSLISNLVNDAKKKYNSKPLGLANVLDVASGDNSIIKSAATGLIRGAENFHVTIMNGELAILGDRCRHPLTASGTMISALPRNSELAQNYLHKGIQPNGAIIFDPEGKPVYINADGVGTKTEFYERNGNYGDALLDFLAMNLDDASKIGANVQAIHAIVEATNNDILNKVEIVASHQFKQLEINGVVSLHLEKKGWKSYTSGVPAFNISGTVVSTINEYLLENPLTPKHGDYLVAIHGNPNPRSNGISSKRKIMNELGEQFIGKGAGLLWHESLEGKIFLDFLGEPSTVLYPVFSHLIDENLATSVYHMSGGAYNGKLGKPIADAGLFVELGTLPKPDWREVCMFSYSGMQTKGAYQQWPMGVDGFVTIKANNIHEVDLALKIIESHGLEGNVVGRLRGDTQRKGVKVTAFNNEKFYFDGK